MGYGIHRTLREAFGLAVYKQKGAWPPLTKTMRPSLYRILRHIPAVFPDGSKLSRPSYNRSPNRKSPSAQDRNMPLPVCFQNSGAAFSHAAADLSVWKQYRGELLQKSRFQSEINY